MAGKFDPDAYLSAKSKPSGGFDPDAYISGKSSEESGGILDSIQKFGQKVDSYTGAPTRAAAMKALEGDFSGAASAFGETFGGDSTKAPSAKDLALKLGVNDNKAELEKAANDPFSIKGLGLKTLLNMGPAGMGSFAPQVGKYLDDKGVSNADLASVPIDFATDWTNAIGLVPATKVAKKGVDALGGLSDLIRGSKNVAKATDTALDAAKAVDKVSDVAKMADGIPATDVIKLANEGKKLSSADDIMKAAKQLGFEATPGMLDSGQTLRGLESSLDQSPSIGGSIVRGGNKGTNQLRAGLKTAVDKFSEDASGLSKFDIGDMSKADIIEKTNELSAPVIKNFNEIASETKLIKVPKTIKEVAANRFIRQKSVKLAPDSPWGQIANRYSKNIKNVKNVDDIKQMRSLALEELRSSTDKNTRSTLGYIAGQLEALEGATIKKAASLAGATPNEGARLGGDLVKKLRTTRKDFRNIIQPLGEFSESVGLKKPRTIKEFVEDISSIPSEQVADKLFKVKNVKAMMTLKDKFPTSWSNIRGAKIADIVKSSSVKGEINPNKLVKNLKAMGPEIRELLFDSPDVNKNLDALEKVLNALPDKIGPSGTPQGEMFMNLLRPAFQAQEGARAGLYKQLQNPTIPFSQLNRPESTLKFRKAGQVAVGGLSDLLEQLEQLPPKVNAGRTLLNASKLGKDERK